MQGATEESNALAVPLIKVSQVARDSSVAVQPRDPGGGSECSRSHSGRSQECTGGDCNTSGSELSTCMNSSPMVAAEVEDSGGLAARTAVPVLEHNGGAAASERSNASERSCGRKSRRRPTQSSDPAVAVVHFACKMLERQERLRAEPHTGRRLSAYERKSLAGSSDGPRADETQTGQMSVDDAVDTRDLNQDTPVVGCLASTTATVDSSAQCCEGALPGSAPDGSALVEQLEAVRRELEGQLEAVRHALVRKEDLLEAERQAHLSREEQLSKASQALVHSEERLASEHLALSHSEERLAAESQVAACLERDLSEAMRQLELKGQEESRLCAELQAREASLLSDLGAARQSEISSAAHAASLQAASEEAGVTTDALRAQARASEADLCLAKSEMEEMANQQRALEEELRVLRQTMSPSSAAKEEKGLQTSTRPGGNALMTRHELACRSLDKVANKPEDAKTPDGYSYWFSCCSSVESHRSKMPGGASPPT